MIQEENFKDDERIRNEIIAFVEQNIHRGGGTPISQEQEDEWIAWLESKKAIDVLDKEEREFADNVDSYRKEIDAAYQKGYNEGVKAALEDKLV